MSGIDCKPLQGFRGRGARARAQNEVAELCGCGFEHGRRWGCLHLKIKKRAEALETPMVVGGTPSADAAQPSFPLRCIITVTTGPPWMSL